MAGPQTGCVRTDSGGMSAKRKLIFVSVCAALAAVSALGLIHGPSINLLARCGIALGAMVVFDWLIVLILPQLRSDKRVRRIFVLFTLPAAFIAFAGVALAYPKTFYYGLISFIVGVILSRSLRKQISEAIAEMRSVVKKEEATSH
jgi:hypothetical protein